MSVLKINSANVSLSTEGNLDLVRLIIGSFKSVYKSLCNCLPELGLKCKLQSSIVTFSFKSFILNFYPMIS